MNTELKISILNIPDAGLLGVPHAEGYIYLSRLFKEELAKLRNLIAEGQLNPWKHNCWVVDSADGPCYECDMASEWEDESLDLINQELAKRK